MPDNVNRWPYMPSERSLFCKIQPFRFHMLLVKMNPGNVRCQANQMLHLLKLDIQTVEYLSLSRPRSLSLPLLPVQSVEYFLRIR